jgi:long-chain acyl-CoA synthetase
VHPYRHALTDPGKAACIEPDSGRLLTYRMLNRRANQGARLLRALGLKRGDVIATVLPNSQEVFEIAWAAQRIGLYLTTISTKLSAADAGYILDDSGARILIAASSLATEAAAATIARPQLTRFLTDSSSDGFADWSEEANRYSVEPLPDESPGADMLYSSGTTGRPKGVKPPLPEGPIDAPTALASMGQNLYGMDASSIYLSTSPLYHAAPLRWAMTIHRLGGTVIVMEQFDASQTLSLIERYRVTHATFVPTHFVRLLKLPEADRKRADISTLKAAVHAAAPCPVPVKRAMIAWWGPIIHEYYAGTESCGITALSAQEWLTKPGSVGRSVLGTVKITDDGGKELPAGETGNVYFADGPRFEYHNDPSKTADAYDHRGWATLGDIGRLDEDGYLFLTDRKHFMIISGGVNIYPQEIENLIITHPQVIDVAVIGAPDEEMGEKVVAIVQPANWSDAGAALAEELRAFTRNALGGVKCPRQFEFRQSLPREPTGKLMKRLLQQEYRNKSMAGSSTCEVSRG